MSASLSDAALSQHIETMMVEQNPRGMQHLYANQLTGTYLRAAKYLYKAQGTVLIGTGFANGLVHTHSAHVLRRVCQGPQWLPYLSVRHLRPVAGLYADSMWTLCGIR